MPTTQTKFWTYKQHNSGGSFAHNEVLGIGYRVVVEATSPEHADNRAESIGLYFDGCDKGRDCSCCGDRWYSAWGEGDEEPLYYGEPVAGGCGIPSYIHYLDGRIERRDENYGEDNATQSK